MIQHEFAHQIDFLVLTDGGRAAVQALLGGGALRALLAQRLGIRNPFRALTLR